MAPAFGGAEPRFGFGQQPIPCGGQRVRHRHADTAREADILDVTRSLVVREQFRIGHRGRVHGRQRRVPAIGSQEWQPDTFIPLTESAAVAA